MLIYMRFSSKLLGKFYLPGFITTRSYFSHGQNSEIEVSSIHMCGIWLLPDRVQLIRYSDFWLKNKIFLYFSLEFNRMNASKIKISDFIQFLYCYLLIKRFLILYWFISWFRKKNQTPSPVMSLRSVHTTENNINRKMVFLFPLKLLDSSSLVTTYTTL